MTRTLCNPRTRVGVVLLGLLAAGWSLAQDVLISGLRVVGDGPAPISTAVAVPGAGDFVLTLTDEAFPSPSRLVSLDGLLLDPTGAVVASGSLAAPIEFTADEAGTYELVALGALNDEGGGALYTVALDDASGTRVLTLFESIIEPVPTVERSNFLFEVEVLEEGDYTLDLVDFEFPAPLSELSLLVISQADELPVPVMDGVLAMLPAGLYDIAIVATPDATRQLGAFGVAFGGGPSMATLLDETIAITVDGSAASFGASTFQAPTAGEYTFTLSDFAFPVPLDSLAGLITLGGREAARLDAPGSVTATLEVETYQLLTDAVPDAASGSGTFGVNIAGGEFGETVLDTVGTVEAAEADAGTADIAFGVAESGDLVLEVVDFNFPSSFLDLTVLLLEGPNLVGTLAGPGELTFSAVGGQAFSVLLVGTPDTAGGLLGVTVQDTEGVSLVETSVALGAAFASEAFVVNEAGRHSATVEDLAFPVAFTDLRAIVTRGADTVGTILSAGSFNFEAQPGEFRLSVLAQPTEMAPSYGTFSFTVAENPEEAPPPEPAPPPDDDEQQTGGGGGGGGSSTVLPLLAALGWAGRRFGARRQLRAA